MGLIEIRQGEGTYVRSFDSSNMIMPLNSMLLLREEDLVNLSDIRKVLEIGVIQAAVIKHLDGNLREIKHWIEVGKRALGEKKQGSLLIFTFM